MSSGAQANLTSAFYRPVRKTKLTGRGCPLAFDLFSFRALMIDALVALAHVSLLRLQVIDFIEVDFWFVPTSRCGLVLAGWADRGR
jgi:hypothetical protein